MVPLCGMVNSALSESSLKILAVHEALFIIITHQQKTMFYFKHRTWSRPGYKIPFSVFGKNIHEEV